MLYTTTSVKPVIARVIRNVGKNLPSEYFDDILEWIPEGIKKLKTNYTVEEAPAKTIQIEGHIGALPCGIVGLLAVEYCGCRLREGGDVRHLPTAPTDIAKQNELELWETDTETPKNYNPDEFPDNSYTEERRGEDLVRVGNQNQREYYKLVPNYIHTSFECGEITLYYMRLPVDEEGYPAIPDNENYKTALYWYVLMMMIGAGYEHNIFSYTDCEQRWEKYARMAINEVKYPTVDRMERIYRAFTRLIPPEHFYGDFRVGSEQIQQVKGI